MDQVFSADDVATSLGNPAPGILDQRTGHEVGPVFSRLMLFRKFPVAVVNKDQGLGADFLDEVDHFLDLGNREAFPGVVAPGPLDSHNLRLVPL